jgi:hypothetical protein
MKKLYQTLKLPFLTLPLANPEFELLKCPGFLMKLALHETPPSTEKHLCYMDNYQLKEMDLLKKIGINFNKITITQ